MRGRYDKANLEEISADGQSLVAAMLTYNPMKRITASVFTTWFRVHGLGFRV